MDTLILDDGLPYWAEPFYDGDTLQLSRQGTEILGWMEKLGTAQGTACAQAIRDWDIAKARENGLMELSAQWRTQSRAPHEVGQLLVAAAAPTECLPCQQMALADPEPEPVEVTPEGLWEGCIGVEGQLTGDGRLIDLNALRWDDEEQLALGTTPLRYVPIDVGAHDGAQVVGRILSIERRPGGILWGKGDLDLDSEVGREAHRQLDKKLTTGVSMDLDDVSFEVRVAEEIAEQVEVALESGTDEPVMPVAREVHDDGTVTVVKINSDDEIRVTTDGRIRAATIVAIPAFAEARIGLVASAWAYNPRQARVPKGHGRYSGRWVAMPTYYGKSMSEIAMPTHYDKSMSEIRQNRAGMERVEPSARARELAAEPLDPKTAQEMIGGSGEKYLTTNADGTVTFTPERQELHAKIIESQLRGGKEGNLVFSFMGGGPATGKSSMESAARDISTDKAVINADSIKELLPEYSNLKTTPVPGDGLHNYFDAAGVHAESSHLTKKALQLGFERKVGMTLDGTGDGTVEGVRSKLQMAKDNGYRVDAYYTSLDIDKAWDRSKARADSSGRYVPEAIVRNTNVAVSQIVPQVMDEFDTFKLFDSDVPKGEPAVLVAHKQLGGSLVIEDQGAWDAFVERGNP